MVAGDTEQNASLLIVDDQPENVGLLVRILHQAGYRDITTTTDPTRVSELRALCRPDVVLLDLHMPVRDGFEVLESLAPFVYGPDRLPVVMITADDSTEVKRKALSLGAKDFVGKPFDAAEVVLRIRNLLETRVLHRQLRQHNDELEHRVAARTKELEEAQVEMLERLASAVEYRDDATGDHTRRVGLASAQLATQIGLGAPAAELMRRAAPLHDIGKVAIADAILLKPGTFTDDERLIMHTHTTIGSEMLARGRSELVRLAQRIARSHHEKWDGSGYPDGLVGKSIPLEARIVAVADFLDALTHDRPYRKAWPLSHTVEEIGRAAGSHFDPVVVDALMQIDRASGLDTLLA